MNLLFAILATILLVAAIRWFISRAPKYGKPFLIRVGLILVAVVVLGMALSGRLHWLMGLLAGLLPFARRLLPLLRWLPFIQQQRQRAGQRRPGQASEVETRWLRMVLDHDSGTMHGHIIGSAYIGRQLEDLSISELRDFYGLCRQEDPEAIRLLDAYIQRHCSEEWNEMPNGPPPTDSGAMSTTEALEILGLQQGASRQEVLEAHKRMMQRVHPDRGGSNYLAAKINQAKERLLAVTE